MRQFIDLTRVLEGYEDIWHELPVHVGADAIIAYGPTVRSDHDIRAAVNLSDGTVYMVKQTADEISAMLEPSAEFAAQIERAGGEIEMADEKAVRIAGSMQATEFDMVVSECDCPCPDCAEPLSFDSEKRVGKCEACGAQWDLYGPRLSRRHRRNSGHGNDEQEQES